MASADMARLNGSVVIKGHSGHLVVPIVIIPVVAVTAFTYYRERLPSFCVENGAKVIAVSTLLTLMLAVAAWFLRSRRVELHGDRLHYHSWITDRTLRIEDVTAVTFETEISGGDGHDVIERCLTLWSGADARLRFSTQRWPQGGLRRLLCALHERRPSIHLDLDVERYIAG